MEQSASDIFASLLNPGGTPEKPKRAQAPAPAAGHLNTTVTPGTVARVRAELAEEAHAAQLAAAEAEKAALQESLETEREVAAELAADLAAARAETEEARAASDARIAELEAECARLQTACSAAETALAAEKAMPKIDSALERACAEQTREIERLQALLVEAQRTSLSASVLLEKPSTFSEKFTGEIREHVLEALSDASEAAEAGGRDRRARILEAVLCANAAGGELAARRAAVKQIMKDAGPFIDDGVIAALGKLGFRYISGSNHHKLEFAGIRFPVAKTPSDHRSCLNSAAEICNRVF